MKRSGWGYKNETLSELLDAELRSLDKLVEDARYQPTLVKEVKNDDNLQLVLDAQNADGIEDGFSFLHLEQMALGNASKRPAGPCIASSGAIADSGRILAECYLFQRDASPFGPTQTPFAPYSYRAGRHHAELGGNSEGGFLAAHAHGKLTHGILPRTYATGSYKEWGKNDNLLRHYSNLSYAVTGTERVTTAERLLELITNEYRPAQIATSFNFMIDDSEEQLAGMTVQTPVNPEAHANSYAVYGCVFSEGEWYTILIDQSSNPFLLRLEQFEYTLSESVCLSVGDITLEEIEDDSTADTSDSVIATDDFASTATSAGQPDTSTGSDTDGVLRGIDGE